MNASSWRQAHSALDKLADCADLRELTLRTRHFAREILPGLVAQCSCKHGWTPEKARLLTALDEAGLTREGPESERHSSLSLAVKIWELALVDAGAAVCILSGSLAQMPIREFGTEEQREHYLGNPLIKHGALCLTEPLPGAGADATLLTGRMSREDSGGALMLRIRKRGRFTSHVDFADFVLAAVEGDGTSVRGSGLVILDPSDEGLFDRGVPIRKLGHHCASTANPSFDLIVPAGRLVGGFEINEGVIAPCLNHRQLLEPALRRMRAMLALMTAAKALASVEERGEDGSAAPAGRDLDLADLWAAGEAAKALGFSAVQLSDEQGDSVDIAAKYRPMRVLFPSAAKLYSSNALPTLLARLAQWSAQDHASAQRLHARMADAQIEEMYMGPSAVQRRLISAAITTEEFLAAVRNWHTEIQAQVPPLPREGADALAAAMRLWLWTLDRLRGMRDARGALLFREPRQSVAFAMADTLGSILAARALALDLVQANENPEWNTSFASLYGDLFTLAAAQAAGQTQANSSELLFGYAPRFSLSRKEEKGFLQLRAEVFLGMRGAMAARERIVARLGSTAS